MPSLSCITNIFRAGNFGSDSGTVIIPTGTAPFPMETRTLSPSLFVDANTFYSPRVSPPSHTLTPSLVTDADTFYSPAVAAWVTVYSQTFNADSGAWTGFNMRQVVNSALFAATNGTSVRLKLQASSTEGAQIDSMYMGHQAGAGDPYDFDGTQVQVKVNGSGSFTVPGSSGVLHTDANSYSFDHTKNFVIACHFSNSAADSVASKNSVTNVNNYFKSAADDSATANVSGYTTSSGSARLVSRIEVM